MHIGKYLKKKREEKGYSQERLAELVGVSERTIRRIENNSNPKENNTFERICNILNIPLSDDKNIKKLKFNKDVDYLKPSEILLKLELENSQELYFEIDNKLTDAYRLAKEGNYKEALDIYLAFSVILPKEYIYIACANMHYMLNNYNSAIEYSEKALVINEKSYEALIIKGISYGVLKDYNSSIDVLLKALEVNKTYEVYYNIGVAYHMTEKINEAISYYDKCIEINPYFESAHLNIGVCYFAKINLEKSLYHLNTAIKLDPNMYQVYGRLGEHYRFISEDDKAVMYFKKCLELDKTNKQALFGISMSLISLGEIHEAIIYFGELFRLYLKDYIDINKEFGRDYVVVDIGYKKTEIIKYQYYDDYIILSIKGRSYKVNLSTDNGFVLIGALPISDGTSTILYPTLGKVFKNKKEFNDAIEQIKSSVKLMQYFDKPIHINFEREISANIIERKKDVFMEIIFDNKYRIIGITDTKGEGFKTFIKLFKQYGQFRVHLEFDNEVFIIDALKNINLNLI